MRNITDGTLRKRNWYPYSNLRNPSYGCLSLLKIPHCEYLCKENRNHKHRFREPILAQARFVDLYHFLYQFLNYEAFLSTRKLFHFAQAMSKVLLVSLHKGCDQHFFFINTKRYLLNFSHRKYIFSEVCFRKGQNYKQ